MRVYNLDENLKCTCGHKWDEHHHSAVMNPLYATYPLTIGGMIAEECEHNQVNGSYFLNKNEKTYCECSIFKPRAEYVKNLIKEWVKKNG